MKVKSDCKFDVRTPTRVFQLQAESVQVMDAWIAAISGTAANHIQTHKKVSGFEIRYLPLPLAL